MRRIVFECLRCGNCCKNLIKETDGFHGLNLFPEEKSLFPEGMVSPNFGVGFGDKDDSKPRRIVSYQLNVKNCPHLAEDNQCRIYEKRPLACQAFPFMPMHLGSAMSPTCRFVRRIERMELLEFTTLMDGVFGMVETPEIYAPEEFEAGRKIRERIQKSYGDSYPHSEALWEFDLRTEKWKIVWRSSRRG